MFKMVKKILVAEHNPAVMTMIVDYLKSHFKAIKVETARSSEELLKKSISAELLGKPYAFIYTVALNNHIEGLVMEETLRSQFISIQIVTMGNLSLYALNVVLMVLSQEVPKRHF